MTARNERVVSTDPGAAEDARGRASQRGTVPRHQQRPNWRLPCFRWGVFDRRWVVVVLSVFSVLVLLLSSILLVPRADGSSGSNSPIVADSSRPGAGSDSNTEPYEIPQSMYPVSSFVTGTSNNSTWVRLASTSSSGLSFFSMVYVTTNSTGGNLFVAQ
jgi:hypothetical protein